MTTEKREPQSLAHVLAEADAGGLNKALSADWQRLMDALDDDSMLHDKVSKGAITITFKVSNDHGKVFIEPAEPKVKLPPRAMTGARMFRDDAGLLTTQDPRVAHDLFRERALAAKAEKKEQAKSAAAPKAAGKVD